MPRLLCDDYEETDFADFTRDHACCTTLDAQECHVSVSEDRSHVVMRFKDVDGQSFALRLGYRAALALGNAVRVRAPLVRMQA